MVPGGTHRNLAFVEEQTLWPLDAADGERYFFALPQTSGGLLIAIPEAQAAAGHPDCTKGDT